MGMDDSVSILTTLLYCYKLGHEAELLKILTERARQIAAVVLTKPGTGQHLSHDALVCIQRVNAHNLIFPPCLTFLDKDLCSI